MRRGLVTGVNVDSNSTNTPLNAGESFVGTWFPTESYSAITIAMLTDTDCILCLEQSPDKVNVDSSLDFIIEANENEVHRVVCTRKYFRIKIINNTTNQTFLRAQTQIGFYEMLTSPLNQSSQQDADAIVTKSFTEEFLIAAGYVKNKSIVNKFGFNPDIDTGSVPEDVWGGDGGYTGFNAIAAEPLSIVSTDVNDTAAGTGLRSIRVTGLDANFNVLSETITLNGTTPVTSVNSFIRAHTATGVSAGSGGVNAGLITISQSVTTANVFLVMQIGRNQTNNSGYTIPAGFTGYLRQLTAAIRGGATLSATGLIWTRPFGGVFRSRRPFAIATASRLVDEIYGGLVFTEKSDIIIRIDEVSANNAPISAGYDLILVKNN